LVATFHPNAEYLFLSDCRQNYSVTVNVKKWAFILAAILAVAIANVKGAAGLAFDASGNLFLLGANPSTIFKFSLDGAVKKFATAQSGEDWEGVATDGQGNVFVATDATDDHGEVITRILKFTPAGKRSVYVGNVAEAQPKTLAIDRDGNLFVAVVSVKKPRGSDAIYKVTAGARRKSAFTTAIEDPTFLALDNAGNLFVYQENGKIFKLAPNGSEILSITSPETYDLACDQAGNLFIALPHSKEIAKVAPDGTKTTFATDVAPWFLAIDKIGNVFVLDNGIVKFSRDGSRTPFAPNPIK
jgi:sugar lactone lactonase YvrE